MLDLITLLTSLWISIIDQRTYRITNRSLMFVGVIFAIDSHQSGLVRALFAVSITAPVAYLIGIGAGDIKLFALLVICQGEIIFTAQYLTFLTATATSLLLVRLASERDLHGSIAFGPVILLPATAIYLAM
jgi:Flp pilus assembly protein protease CpaA